MLLLLDRQTNIKFYSFRTSGLRTFIIRPNLSMLLEFKKQRKKIWFLRRLDQFQTIYSIRTLIIREFEKDIKTEEKKTWLFRAKHETSQNRWLWNSWKMGIPRWEFWWEFQITWLFPARLEISLKAFILLELL